MMTVNSPTTGEVNRALAEQVRDDLFMQILRLSRNPMVNSFSRSSLIDCITLLGDNSLYKDIEDDVPGSTLKFEQITNVVKRSIDDADCAVRYAISKLPRYRKQF